MIENSKRLHYYSTCGFLYFIWFHKINAFFNTSSVSLISRLHCVDVGPFFELFANILLNLGLFPQASLVVQCEVSITNLGTLILVSAEISNFIAWKTFSSSLEFMKLKLDWTYLYIFTFGKNVTPAYIIHQFFWVFFHCEFDFFHNRPSFAHFRSSGSLFHYNQTESSTFLFMNSDVQWSSDNILWLYLVLHRTETITSRRNVDLLLKIDYSTVVHSWLHLFILLKRLKFEFYST